MTKSQIQKLFAEFEKMLEAGDAELKKAEQQIMAKYGYKGRVFDEPYPYSDEVVKKHNAVCKEQAEAREALAEKYPFYTDRFGEEMAGARLFAGFLKSKCKA